MNFVVWFAKPNCWRKLRTSSAPACTKKTNRLTKIRVLKINWRTTLIFFIVIAVYDFWCYRCDPETKRLTGIWKTNTSPQPKKSRPGILNSKTINECVFDVRGILCIRIRSSESNGSKVFFFFFPFIWRYWESCHDLRKKPHELWQTGDCFFHHYNSPGHTALSVQRFFYQNHEPCTPPTVLTGPHLVNIFAYLSWWKMSSKEKVCRFGEGKKEASDVLKIFNFNEFKSHFEH